MLVLGVISSFAIIFPRTRGWLLYFNCIVTVCVLCLFLMTLWVSLCAIFLSYSHIKHVCLTIAVLVFVLYCCVFSDW